MEQYIFLCMHRGSPKQHGTLMCTLNKGSYCISCGREGISNKQLQVVKNIYGDNAVDRSTVSHWTSQTAGSEEGQAKLKDMHHLASQ
jgi:hypothetical protein